MEFSTDLNVEIVTSVTKAEGYRVVDSQNGNRRPDLHAIRGWTGCICCSRSSLLLKSVSFLRWAKRLCGTSSPTGRGAFALLRSVCCVPTKWCTPVPSVPVH